MPLPKTKNVGKVMNVLNKEGGRSREQKVAIALSVTGKSKKRRKYRAAEGGMMKA